MIRTRYIEINISQPDQEVGVKRDQVLPFTSSSLQLEDDLIRLNTLNEAVISFNLEHRYKEGQVYVSAKGG